MLNVLIKGMLLILILSSCSPQPTINPPEPLETIFLSPLGDAPVEIATNKQTGKVYILNRNNSLFVLNGQEVITTLSVGNQARPAIAIDEQRDKTYVVNEYDDTITVIQGTTVITTIEVVGRSPTDIAIDEKSGQVYVVSNYKKSPPIGEIPIVEGNLTVIGNNQVIASILLGDTITDLIVIDPIDSYIYVGSVGGYVIVLKDMQEIARYNMEATIKSMDVDPRTGDVYALYRAPNSQQLSRFKQGKLVDSATVEGEGGAVQTVKVHPVTGDLYIVDYSREEVVVVHDMQVVERIPVDWQPEAITIDPFTSNVYVTSLGYDTVTVIQNTEVLTKISVGWYPLGIGVNPANGWVYVANTNDDSVTVLGIK